MKKTLVCLLIGAMTLTAFAACDNNSTETTKKTTAATTVATTTAATTTADKDADKTPDTHTHTAGAIYQVDRDDHWLVCECGEVLDSAPHTTEDDICTVCEAEVYVYEDGAVTVAQYTDQGDCFYAIEYDADGKVLSRQVSEYTYDDNDNMLTSASTYYGADGSVEFTDKFECTYDQDGKILMQKSYQDDKLISECEYSLDADSWPYVSKETLYYDDGTKVVYEYNENYDTVSEVWYDADGSIMDNSDKFDAEACEELFGTWTGEMDMADFLAMDTTVTSFKIMITMILTDQGEINMAVSIDENELRNFMYEMTLESIYVSFEEEGLSREDADVAFEAQMGMTIAEYVEAQLDEMDMNEFFGEMPEAYSGVYYVEDGMIYAGESWNQRLEGVAYTLDGDTLTLVYDEEGVEMELVFSKVTD